MAEEAERGAGSKGKGKGKESLAEEEGSVEGYEADDDEEVATANPKMAYTSIVKDRFGRVICDEAHALKNLQTLTHLAIKYLFAPKMWFISATLMINRVRGLTGHLSLMWDDDWSLGEELDLAEFYAVDIDAKALLDEIEDHQSHPHLNSAAHTMVTVIDLGQKKLSSVIVGLK